ncbi:alpha/beta fold hydrolase [Pseudonocardia sp. CA-107938]|uniref:alpha/beta fold hydrolase n=1 Tax=Pseudonocardia sp. CA-107938 TaxID=3240021 RepID=UPI003D946547
MVTAPTVVLVHGAFADASGFRGLYDNLKWEGLSVIAPPNPLRGLTGGDGEYLKSVIAGIDGPVLLVGHSYGGAVITAAGGAENVTGLVYLAGYAPDEGENLTDLQSSFPEPKILPFIVQQALPDGGTEFSLSPAAFPSLFCPDLPADDAAFYAVTQRPLAGVALSEAAPRPAWRSKPAWAVLPTADLVIDPGVHRFSYDRAGATVTELEGASHAVMTSRPDEVAQVVLAAARAGATQPA